MFKLTPHSSAWSAIEGLTGDHPADDTPLVDLKLLDAGEVVASGDFAKLCLVEAATQTVAQDILGRKDAFALDDAEVEQLHTVGQLVQLVAYKAERLSPRRGRSAA